ncbi:probable calcium-binding protein CML23 [Diospyros lotus]|uniref:probable calcium-binding protein CML23 n=1 Tax=Diospyros lotus TaxID=55363 RepID=UPI002255A00F|nr:probable calcium-binding protein CML23 [Diospyros lotus]
MATTSSSNGKRTIKKTTTTLGDMDEVAKVFNRFDANGDGKISAAEMTAVLGALGSGMSAEEVRGVMAEIDRDGDGFVDLREFADFHSKALECDDGSANKELRDAFDVYDRDGNGLISATELHTVLKSLGEKCSLKDCRQMISSVDMDGDGCVNFEEFQKMMRP